MWRHSSCYARPVAAWWLLRGSEGSTSCFAAALCDVDDFFTALYSVYTLVPTTGGKPQKQQLAH